MAQASKWVSTAPFVVAGIPTSLTQPEPISLGGVPVELDPGVDSRMSTHAVRADLSHLLSRPEWSVLAMRPSQDVHSGQSHLGGRPSRRVHTRPPDLSVQPHTEDLGRSAGDVTRADNGSSRGEHTVQVSSSRDFTPVTQRQSNRSAQGMSCPRDRTLRDHGHAAQGVSSSGVYTSTNRGQSNTSTVANGVSSSQVYIPRDHRQSTTSFVAQGTTPVRDFPPRDHGQGGQPAVAQGVLSSGVYASTGHDHSNTSVQGVPNSRSSTPRDHRRSHRRVVTQGDTTHAVSVRANSPSRLPSPAPTHTHHRPIPQRLPSQRSAARLRPRPAHLPLVSSGDDDDEEGCCYICIESRRYLKMLPCRHCFCEYCLQQIVNQHTVNTSIGSFPCPFCRAQITVPRRGASDFPIYSPGNMQTLRMEEVAATLRVSTEQEWSSMCEDCGQEVRKYTCVQCQKVVCEFCRHDHQHHPMVLLPNLTSLDLNNGQAGCHCSKHRSHELRFFCCQCEELLCQVCQTQSHAGHHVQTVNQAASTATRGLQQAQLSVQRTIRCLRVAQEQIAEGKNLTLENISQTERSIRSRAAEARAVVDQQEQAALTALNIIRHTLGKKLTAELNIVEDKIAGLSAVLSHMERVLHSDNQPDIVRIQVSARDSVGKDGFLDKYIDDLPNCTYNIELKHRAFNCYTEVVKQWIGTPGVVPTQHTLPVVMVEANVALSIDTMQDATMMSVCHVGNQHVWITYKQPGNVSALTTIALCNLATGHVPTAYDGTGPVSLVKIDQGLAMATLHNCQIVLVIQGEYENLSTLHRYDRFIFAKRELRACLRITNDCDLQHTELVVNVKTAEDVFASRLPGEDTFVLSGIHSPRVMDMSEDGQLFVVVDEENTMHFIRRSAQQAHMVVRAEDNRKLMQEISDVCFYKLGGRELLLVADPSQHDVLVLDVRSTHHCSLLAFLTNMSGRLKFPSALNVDSTKGHLVVACKGKSIAVCGDTGVQMGDGTKSYLARLKTSSAVPTKEDLATSH